MCLHALRFSHGNCINSWLFFYFLFDWTIFFFEKKTFSKTHSVQIFALKFTKSPKTTIQNACKRFILLFCEPKCTQWHTKWYNFSFWSSSVCQHFSSGIQAASIFVNLIFVFVFEGDRSVQMPKGYSGGFFPISFFANTSCVLVTWDSRVCMCV